MKSGDTSSLGGSLWKNLLKSRNLRRWLPGMLVSIIALVVLFRLANFKELSVALTSTNLLALAMAVVLTVISLGTRAQAWRVLLDWKTTFRKSFFIINEGYLLNNLFPLRAGEVARALFMGQASGLGTLHVLSTIVLERAFDLAMAAGLILATLPMALGVDWAKPVAAITLVLVIIGLSILYLIARYNQWVIHQVSHFGERWPIVNRLVIPWLNSLLNGLGVLTRPSQFFLSLFWILVSWAIWVSTHFIMLRSIASQAPFWWAAFVDGLLALGVAIPSAPAALGLFEGALVGALSILGISNSTALAYAIVLHFVQFFTTAIFGLIGLSREGQSIESLAHEMEARV